MVKPLRLVCALVMLAVLLAPLAALQFNVTVTNEIGTRLPGTKVQILVANTTLYEQTTIWCPKIDAEKGCPLINDKAMVNFELSPETYFLRLQRSGYPDHVYLQTISENTNIEMIMFIKKSTYTIFGRVPSDIADYEGETIKLVDDASGAIIRSSAIKDNNYFILESLWPDKVYHLRIDRGTERLLSNPFSHAEVGAYYVEINSASEPLRNITILPSLNGPIQADLHSKISPRLMAGERPMAGQVILVTTPTGSLNLTTDSNGYVSIWAAEGGDYVFNWQTITYAVNVPKEEEPAAPAPVAPAPAPVAPAANVAPEVPSVDAGAAVGAVSLAALALLGVAIIIVFAALFGRRLIKAKGAEKSGHVFEPVKPSLPSSAQTYSPPAFAHEPKHETHVGKHPTHGSKAKHHAAKHPTKHKKK